MNRKITLVVFSLAAAMLCACANPAADKPKAAVSNSAAESSAPKSGAEKLTISPDNSKIEFTASKVTRSHNGAFKHFAGTIDLVPDALESSRVSIDIDTGSVVTDEEQLTGHLKTADFFNIAKYPKATFVSTKLEAAKNGSWTHSVTGNFDLHGVKKAITFPAAIQLAPDSVGINSEFSINRKDFQILYPGKADDLIRDEVVIKLSLKVPRR